ncbi:MAG: AraC family transcriptional regulator [Paenibacillus sp.]|nr:AraC family transcriptional regulator [Paenibacillus sp.]
MPEPYHELNLWVTDISFVLYRHPDPQWKVDNATSKHHTIAFSTGGQAMYTISGKPCQVNKGDVLFFPKHTPRTGFSLIDDPWSFYVVQFDAIFPDTASEQQYHRIGNVITGSVYSHASSLFQDLHREWTARKPGYLLKCQSRIIDIICLLLRHAEQTIRHPRHYQAVDTIVNLIAENYSKNYSVDEICQTIGYSASHFQLIFKKVTGITIIQYQNEIKINKARDLLQYGNCNVTEAALQVGFNDMNYFSRLYKKMTGHNPSEYLKRG